MNIYRTLNFKTAEYPLFLSIYKTFTKITGPLSEFQQIHRIKYIWIMFSDNSLIKIEMFKITARSFPKYLKMKHL